MAEINHIPCEAERDTAVMSRQKGQPCVAQRKLALLEMEDLGLFFLFLFFFFFSIPSVCLFLFCLFVCFCCSGNYIIIQMA